MLGKVTSLAAAAVSLTATVAQGDQSFAWSNTEYMIAFGDSYTYVQGTAGLQNFSFIGDQFDFAYNSSTLLSDRIVQNLTSTAEGGPNWIEHLTGCGLKPGLTNPRQCERQLWDFAFAGADISTEYTPLHHNFTVSFQQQIKQFQLYGHPVLSEFVDPSRTLVAIWIGINDIGDTALEDVDFPKLYSNLTSTLFQSVQTVYDLGYRDFLVINLPPLNRSPSNVIREGGPLPNATMISWYDEALYSHMAQFQRANVGSNTMYFDTTSFLNTVMDHAEDYGIKNITGYCASYDQPYIITDPAQYDCLPLHEYFWFNTGHMTSHTHKILAAELEDFLNCQ